MIDFLNIALRDTNKMIYDLPYETEYEAAKKVTPLAPTTTNAQQLQMLEITQYRVGTARNEMLLLEANLYRERHEPLLEKDFPAKEKKTKDSIDRSFEAIHKDNLIRCPRTAADDIALEREAMNAPKPVETPASASSPGFLVPIHQVTAMAWQKGSCTNGASV